MIKSSPKNRNNNIGIRAPKLRSLKNQAVFSETVGISGEGLTENDDDLVLSSPPVSRPKVARQMSHQDYQSRQSHQDRRTMMTPKRKCSFSSFSECRYVVDGGKTTTFLFSIETPSHPHSQDTTDHSAIEAPQKKRK